MPDPDPPSSEADPDRHPLDLVAEQFATALRRGERPSVADYAKRHPALADQLRDVLPPIALMERLKARNLSGAAAGLSSTSAAAARDGTTAGIGGGVPERVGDFRVVREVGRGGMGIVYEARQESLDRTVALKVLSRASLLDPQRVDRFDREARAAAGLHHTNIVPVFGVGHADGLHYIVMPLIRGRTLADVVRQLAAGELPGDPATRAATRGRGANATADASGDCGTAPERRGVTPSPGTPGEGWGGGQSGRMKDEGRTENEDGDGDDSARSLFIRPTSSLPPSPLPSPPPEYRGREQRPDAGATASNRESCADASFSSGAMRGSDPPRDRMQLADRPLTQDRSPEYGGKATGGGSTLDVDPAVSPVAIPAGRAYWRWVADLGRQAADALDYAHRHRVLHRDVKPGNLLLDDDGAVWVTDFGLAKLAEGRPDVTRAGDVIGTLQYLAPEGLRSPTDARGDVYGLGATLYELLTLKPAFEAPTPAALLRLVADGLPAVPSRINPHVPPDLETVVLKAMARRPEDRYATAAAFADDLANVLHDRPIAARRVSAFERAWRWCRRNRAVASLAATAAAAALVALVTGWAAYGVTSRALTAEATQRATAEQAKASSDRARAAAETAKASAEAATATVEAQRTAIAAAKQRADENVALSLAGFEAIFNQLAPPEFRPPPGQGYPGGGGGGRRGGGGAGFGPPPGRGGRPGGPSGGGRGGGPEGRPDGDGGMVREAALLVSILDFYDRFAKQNPTNEALQAEAAKAYRRVGDSYLRIGQPTDADAAFRRSAKLYTDLLSADAAAAGRPTSTDAVLGLAEAVTWLGLDAPALPPADAAAIRRAAELADQRLGDQRRGDPAPPPSAGEVPTGQRRRLRPEEVEIVARVLTRDAEVERLAGQLPAAEQRYRRAAVAWEVAQPPPQAAGRPLPPPGPDGRPRPRDAAGRPDDPLGLGPPEGGGRPQDGGRPSGGGPPPRRRPNERYLALLGLADVLVQSDRKADARGPLAEAFAAIDEAANVDPGDLPPGGGGAGGNGAGGIGGAGGNTGGNGVSDRLTSALVRLAELAKAAGADDLAARATALVEQRRQQVRESAPPDGQQSPPNGSGQPGGWPPRRGPPGQPPPFREP